MARSRGRQARSQHTPTGPVTGPTIGSDLRVSTEYRVQLDAFEGPLDLLLFLIRRAEVDIGDIPIATITDQYMAYLSGIERIDIELAGEFLVMAATLMEIKSRMLQPPEAAADRGAANGEQSGAQEDPRAELIRQLLAYKQYRDAADQLETRRQDWARRFPSGGAELHPDAAERIISEVSEVDLDDVGVVDLVEAFGRIMSSVNFERLGEHSIVDDDTPVELHAEDILDRLQRDVGEGGRMPLITLFEGRTRGEMIGLFLAMLELVRQQRIGVRQDGPGLDAIVVVLREAPPETPEAPETLESSDPPEFPESPEAAEN